MPAAQQTIVILISGRGSNMLALLEAAERGDWTRRFGARVVGVISNRPGVQGLDLASARGVPTAVVDHKAYGDRAAFDQALAERIDTLAGSAGATWVVLAGFMRILTPGFVERYAGRMVNIHPSLLPAFPGLDTHQRAIDMGCRFAGSTVHRVTAELDHGEILEQAVVPILPGDDAHSLAARVLTQEHIIYPRALERLLTQGALS